MCILSYEILLSGDFVVKFLSEIQDALFMTYQKMK